MCKEQIKIADRAGGGKRRGGFTIMWVMAVIVAVLLAAGWATPALALSRPEVTFPVFQFPPDQMPRIDGDASDWAMVPESYVVGTDKLVDTDHNNAPETLALLMCAFASAG